MLLMCMIFLSIVNLFHGLQNFAIHNYVTMRGLDLFVFISVAEYKNNIFRISIGEYLVEISNKSMKFINFGIKISVLENSLPEGIDTCVLHISFELSTDFETPANFKLLSSIYRVKCEPKVQFKKPLTLEIQHCASLSSDHHQQKFVFARATDQSKKFEILEGGHFPIGERYGSIQLTRFSRLGVFIRKVFGFPTEKMYSALLFRKNSLPHHTIDVKCVVCQDLATHVKVGFPVIDKEAYIIYAYHTVLHA